MENASYLNIKEKKNFSTYKSLDLKGNYIDKVSIPFSSECFSFSFIFRLIKIFSSTNKVTQPETSIEHQQQYHTLFMYLSDEKKNRKLLCCLHLFLIPSPKQTKKKDAKNSAGTDCCV